MLLQADRAVLLWLNHLGPEGFGREVVIRGVATGFYWVLVAIVLYLTFCKPGGKRVFVSALGGFALAFIVGKTINQIVPRDRPFIALPDEVRHIALVVRPDSFPSIHAVSAFGMIGGVLFGRYRWHGLVMLGFGLLMIAARVAAGVHWPTDVLGGAAIGLVMAGAWRKVEGRMMKEEVKGDGAQAEACGYNGEDNALE